MTNPKRLIHSRRLAPASGLVISLASLLAIAPVAFAQQSSISYGLYSSESSFRPDITSGDLRAIERVLGLLPEERTALDALYAGYETNLQQRARDVKVIVNKAAEEAELLQDSRLLDPARKKISEWESEAEKIKKQFLDDLRSLLTKDQEDRWPILERELRRFKSMAQGRLAGESTDIIKLLGEVMPTERDIAGTAPSRVPTAANPRLREMIEQYSAELDRALVERSRVLEKGTDFRSLIDTDAQAAKTLYEDALRVRKVVQDVNRRYVRLVANELPPEKRADLDDRFFRACYPRLFTPVSRAEELLTQAAKLDSLSPAQSRDIADIRSTYDKEIKAWRAEAAVFDDESDESLPIRLQIKLGTAPAGAESFDGSSKLPPDHPQVKLRRKRLIFERDIRERAEKVLTPEQLSAVQYERESNAVFMSWSNSGL
jgi:hypothetical protein